MPTLNGVPLSCEEILDRYGAMVYRLAVQGTGSPVDGEDVAQEVFVSLIPVSYTHLPGRCPRRPWAGYPDRA